MKASIITIGDEILIGQVLDTNSAWLGNELALMGIEVTRILTIGDTQSEISAALDMALEDSELVCLTGGLGPTKDDITKKALCEYVGTGLELDEELRDEIEEYFVQRKIPFLDAHLQQCYMPVDATKLINKMGTAPGMLFNHNEAHILSLPGVPYEMKWIFENSFKPLLNSLISEDLHLYHRTIKTIGRGESQIAENINDILEEMPEGISIAYLPSVGSVRLRITAKASSDKAKEVDVFVDRISERLGNLVYGYDNTELGEAFRDLMVERKLTLSTAESCTGGFLAHQLTSTSGSSAYYMGSIIAYDYEPKKKLLNVKSHTLEKFGAVSEETVKEMLTGLLDNLGTDLGIAISGIAGPGGGTPDKPVGTIWLAWGNKEAQRTRKLQLSRDRSINIRYTAVAGMNALRKFVLSHY